MLQVLQGQFRTDAFASVRIFTMKLKILRSIHFFCVLIFLTLFVGSTAGAAPPVKKGCDEIPETEFNDRIGCKAENANKALYDYVDSVVELDQMGISFGRSPVFTDAQTQHIKAARGRAQNAKVRSHDAKAFRGPAKKQKAENADCYVKELIGDTDSKGHPIGNETQPCEKNENCEEVYDDGIGNDDGICQIKGKADEREVCVQVCQQTLPDDEDNYDITSAFDTEQGLEELEIALINATFGVEKSMMYMQTYYSASPQHLSTGECGNFEFGLWPDSIHLQGAQVAKNVADAVFNSCSVACNQDSFGWNCEAACVVFAVVAGTANAIYDGFSEKDNANGSAQLDRVAKCTRQLDEEVALLSSAVQGTQAAIDEVNTKVDALAVQIGALTTLVEERFLVVEDHLCTPQGRRECFVDHQDR
jgi:hypothetical protein